MEEEPINGNIGGFSNVRKGKKETPIHTYCKIWYHLGKKWGGKNTRLGDPGGNKIGGEGDFPVVALTLRRAADEVWGG